MEVVLINRSLEVAGHALAVPLPHMVQLQVGTRPSEPLHLLRLEGSWLAIKLLVIYSVNTLHITRLKVLLMCVLMLI